MKVDNSKFLDRSGKRVVLGLFKEFARPDVKFRPVYNLKEVKQLFMEAKDPSEYEAAMRIVGCWEHWNEIRNHPLIKQHVDKWQVELAVMLKSEAIKQMQVHAKQPGGTAAAKWLADKGYAEGDVKKVGRPRKEEELPEESVISKRIAGDAARLGIVIGGKVA
jgi:hypothetical protein